MTRIGKLVASGIAATLLLLPAVQAHAEDLDAANKAGEYVVSQIANNATGEVGSTVDSILALFATGDSGLAAQADPLVETVKQQASGYVESGPEAAAKLAILATALGENPTSFAELDLINAITTAVADDGSFGAFPGAFSSSLGIIALGRADVEIPEAMVSFLLAGANEDGGFGYATDQPSDADSTGMVLQALAVVPATDATSKALEAATEWATGNQAKDGSWAGYNPVNSTAVMGMGLLAVGKASDEATAYLVSQQLADGAMPDNGESNLLATSQAALLLGGVSYVSVVQPGGDAAPTAPDKSTAADEQAPTDESGTTDASDSSGGVSPLAWVAGIAVVVGLGGWLAMRRRSNA